MPPKRGKKKAAGKKKATPKKAKAAPAPAPAPEPVEVEEESPAPAPAAEPKASKENKKKKSNAPTVEDILSDNLTKTASEYWAPGSTSKTVGVFKPELVKDIYNTELCGSSKEISSRVMMLEFSCYLENYLWPNFDAESASYEHVMSIIFMVNEKFKENVPAWDTFDTRAEEFPAFVKRALLLPNQIKSDSMETDGGEVGEGGVDLSGMPMRERTPYTLFLINCFQSLENKLIRESFLRLVSLPLWKHVSSRRRQMELEAYPQLRRHWDHLAATDGDDSKQPKKKQKKSSEKKDGGITSSMEANLLPSLFKNFLATLESADTEAEAEPQTTEAGAPGKKKAPSATALYLERSMELLIDLLSQLPTRRFLRLLVLDMQVAAQCSLARFTNGADGVLFKQLLQQLYFYLRFEINDQTGMPLTRRDMTDRHYARMQVLQRIAFKHHGQPGQPLRGLALTGIGAISTREALTKHLRMLPPQDLMGMCEKLSLLPPNVSHTVPLLLEVLVAHHEQHESQLDAINSVSLYPSEELLWNDNLVPLGTYSGESVLALPKLNLQFLTFHDYLLRSFNLFRLESAYEIRQDMVDAIKRMDAKRDQSGTTRFTGWARMCAQIESLTVTEVRKPNIGETKPAEVKAEVQFDLSQFSGHIREEWDQLREHDIVFLVTIRATEVDSNSTGISGFYEKQQQKKDRKGGKGKKKGKGGNRFQEEDCTFASRYGVVHVRGCEVKSLKDEEGISLNDMTGKPDKRESGPVGDKRTLRVLLDSAQYQKDMADQENSDVYDSVNLLVRRKAKENNFKAVLDTIRNLANVSAVNKAVPDWLHDVFLGYGDPGSASSLLLGPDMTGSDLAATASPDSTPALDFKDTFLNADHVRASFPDAKVVFEGADGKVLKEKNPPPPYRVVFEKGKNNGKPNKCWAEEGEVVHIQPYVPANPGPYPQNQPKKNAIAFTPVQTKAIRAGLNKGLTMVVGPPGTGKTDVAVQAISNLYHNFPGQRIIMVTHSNQALNDLFSKIMDRDIDERHLLRLGSGQKDLNTDKDFSKWGRVNYTLQRRITLLAEVERLSVSLSVGEDAGYTCETAAHFQLYHYQSLKEKFEQMIEKGAKSKESVAATFPFTSYFATAPQPLFNNKSFEQDLEIAQGCFRHISSVFEELQDYRAFELLRSGKQRADYLLTKQARIIAMTCTHAALVRPRLVALGFKFDNMVMEESAQILEVETFIPMLLQDYDRVEGCRLKRVILIGDHHQLPPVVKNMAFQKYGHLDQSLFARFVRLGVPTIDLNLQGRARPGIASLYSWRYKELGNLPATLAGEHSKANVGFGFDYQVVNVEDFNGRGESTPTAHFYQNLGEAEYCVAMFQYMRLMGYPASKITILTTYNGQKHLIRDVLEQRCAPFAQFGTCAVSTVDRFQGQQNDFIILSLVRTKAIGHLRDVRRLVVAMSRARLGLYVFCRLRLFENCYELTPTFNTLLQRPSKLQLVMGERVESGTTRTVGDGDAMETDEKAKGKGKGKGKKAEGNMYEVQDVTHMGVLVQQLLQAQ